MYETTVGSRESSRYVFLLGIDGLIHYYWVLHSFWLWVGLIAIRLCDQMFFWSLVFGIGNVNIFCWEYTLRQCQSVSLSGTDN